MVRGEAAVADGVAAVAGGGESISNSTLGGVGGADAGGAALHPLPPRLWQRRPRNVLLVMVLLLLLGSPRVRRDVASVAVYPRLKGVGRNRGKAIIIIFPVVSRCC